MGKKQTARQAESTPELTSSQVIARVVGPRGKNMHEVQYADGQTTLAVLPPRFRNLIWVKRGHYVVLDPEATSSDKMGGEIVHVLFPEHVKDLRSQGKW
jgi:probable RNA-binding protein EIF1AD